MGLEKQVAGKTKTTIEKLSEHILLEILKYLSMKDRCRLRRVSKKWNRVLCDSSLWRHVDLLEYRLDLRTVRKIVRAYFSPRLSTVKIRAFAQADGQKERMDSISDPILKRLTTCCPNLQLLHLWRCRTSNISFERLPASIRCLKMVSSIWQTGWMKDKQKHLAKLEHLTLDWSEQVNAYDVEDIAFWKNLKHLSLKGCRRVGTAAVKTIADHLKELESLNLSGTTIDDLAVHHIAHHLKKLKELSLASCFWISDRALVIIVKGLPVLNKLDISHCENITKRGLEILFVSKLSVLIVVRRDILSLKEMQTLKRGFPKNFNLIA